MIGRRRSAPWSGLVVTAAIALAGCASVSDDAQTSSLTALEQQPVAKPIELSAPPTPTRCAQQFKSLPASRLPRAGHMPSGTLMERIHRDGVLRVGVDQNTLRPGVLQSQDPGDGGARHRPRPRRGTGDLRPLEGSHRVHGDLDRPARPGDRGPARSTSWRAPSRSTASAGRPCASAASTTAPSRSCSCPWTRRSRAWPICAASGCARRTARPRSTTSTAPGSCPIPSSCDPTASSSCRRAGWRRSAPTTRSSSASGSRIRQTKIVGSCINVERYGMAINRAPPRVRAVRQRRARAHRRRRAAAHAQPLAARTGCADERADRALQPPPGPAASEARGRPPASAAHAMQACAALAAHAVGARDRRLCITAATTPPAGARRRREMLAPRLRRRHRRRLLRPLRFRAGRPSRPLRRRWHRLTQRVGGPRAAHALGRTPAARRRPRRRAGDCKARPPAGGHGDRAGRRAAPLLPALRQPGRARPRRRAQAAPRASARAAARRSRSCRSCAPATSSATSTRSPAASPTAAWAGSTSRATATSPTAGSSSRDCSTATTTRRSRPRSPNGCSSPRSSIRTS